MLCTSRPNQALHIHSYLLTMYPWWHPVALWIHTHSLSISGIGRHPRINFAHISRNTHSLSFYLECCTQNIRTMSKVVEILALSGSSTSKVAKPKFHELSNILHPGVRVLVIVIQYSAKCFIGDMHELNFQGNFYKGIVNLHRPHVGLALSLAWPIWEMLPRFYEQELFGMSYSPHVLGSTFLLLISISNVPVFWHYYYTLYLHRGHGRRRETTVRFTFHESTYLIWQCQLLSGIFLEALLQIDVESKYQVFSDHLQPVYPLSLSPHLSVSCTSFRPATRFRSCFHLVLSSFWLFFLLLKYSMYFPSAFFSFWLFVSQFSILGCFFVLPLPSVECTYEWLINATIG